MISLLQRCVAWVREKASPSGVAVAVGALGVAVYSGALSNGFAYDDVLFVELTGGPR